MTLNQIVERERMRLRRWHIAAGVAVVIAATLTILALSALIFGDARWLALPRFAPVISWLVLIAADVAAVLTTRRWLRERTAIDVVSANVEREQALRAGSVRGTMEVAESGALGRRAAEELSARLRTDATLIPATAGSARRRMLRLAGGAIAAAALLAAIAPSAGDGLRAVMRPVDAWRGTLLPALRFNDLPTHVMRGERLWIKVLAPGRREVFVARRPTGEGWETERLAVTGGSVVVDAGPMNGDLYLAASDGRSTTDTVVVHVADRPFLGGVTMRAVYPAYLERPAEGLSIGEPVRIPAGTAIEVAGRASTSLHEVKLMSERDTASLQPSGQAFRGRFVPRASGSWSWRASGAAGAVTDVPPALQVEVIPDSVPRAEIISPMRDTLVASDGRVTLRLSALDDHGLATVDIVSWPTRASRDGEHETAQVAAAPGPVWGTAVELDVARRGLVAGDALHLKLVATDNSPGHQRGESRELIVRVATAQQERELARSAGDSTVAKADAAVAAEKALERRAKEAAQDRATRANPDATKQGANSMNFDAAQKAKALAEDQKALAEQVKQLGQAAKSLEDQLRQAGALDSSLAKQLQEAQAMLRDALTPELMKQLEKLQGAAQQLSKDDAQQSLKDLQAQQQKLREQLEKSAEMLRRAAMEGAMQTLADEAKDLASQQRQLADSAKSGQKQQSNPGAQQQQTANELADRSERLASDMKKLGDRLDANKAATGAEKTDEARQHAQSSEEKLRNGQKNPAAVEDAARDAASQMDQSAQAMKQARDGQVGEWKKELTSALDQSIQEMLQMSREERQLQEQMKSGQTSQGDARGQQSAVKQGLDEAAQRLQREAQKSTLLSGRSQRAVNEAQQKVDQATQSTSDPRSSGQSASQMSDAAEALNKAAASLARDRERANTAGSATGFAEMIQEMQQMAGKQNAINSQAQGIMPNPGMTMNSGAQAQARSLARQQRQVADKLDELGDGAGGDKAAKMAEEARQLADALDGSRIDAGTLARQQQLLKKMLDAGRSLEKDEREQSDRREAKAGNDDHQFRPDAASANGKNANRFREPTWDELRGLSPDERRLILEYFKKLNADREGGEDGSRAKGPGAGNGRGGPEK